LGIPRFKQNRKDSSAMNGDFGTSPPNGGRPSDESRQLISHQRAWQRVRIAVIFQRRGSVASVHDVSGSSARLSTAARPYAATSRRDLPHRRLQRLGIPVKSPEPARGLGSHQLLEIAVRRCGSDSARMSETGQTAKNSPRAYVFRLAPELGHCSTQSELHTKKGRLRCHKRLKSREETPKEGSDSGMGFGGSLPHNAT
jgi:hypothetical protein